MTWRFSETRNAHAVFETGQRAKPRAVRSCPACGTGINGRKQYCAPCSDVRMHARQYAWRREKYQRAKA